MKELWHIEAHARPRSPSQGLGAVGGCCAPFYQGVYLLAPDVLLADTLDGEPLTVEHGAPARLVAPAHYGYKSVKYLSRIELMNKGAEYRVSAFRFMDHPRARVSLEERGRGVPGWFLRYLYRPLIPGTVARFARALAEHETGAPGEGRHENDTRPS